MSTCPSCGSTRVFRSKTRTTMERWRRQFTMKRPYRCHACNWRGWAPDGCLVVAPQDVLDAATAAPNLTAIDQALAESSDDRSQKPEARSQKTGV